MTAPRFMTPRAYAARRQYLREWEAYVADPKHAPKPDPKLLLVDPAFGPILGKVVTTDDRDGAAVIAVTLRSKLGPRDHRYLDPLDALVLDLGLAFGGGLSVNDNTRRPEGKAYARLKLGKWHHGRRQSFALDLTRVFTGAPAGQEVAQQGEYHSLRRRDLMLRPNAKARGTRSDFVEAAAYAFDRNWREAGIEVGREDHLEALCAALELADMVWDGIPLPGLKAAE